MTIPRSALWRVCFVLAGVLILAGGPLHPGGSMAEMLAHPDWVLSQLFPMVMLFALWCVLAGLWPRLRGEPVARRNGAAAGDQLRVP